MRRIAAFITVFVMLLVCGAAIAAENAPPPPAPPPPAPEMRPSGPPPVLGGSIRPRGIVVGPTDSQGPARRVRGEVTVTVVVPPTVRVASVEVLFNSALIGKVSEAPYQVRFKTDTVTEGPHEFRAVGLDVDGKQVWSATTKVEVRNLPATVTGLRPTAPGANPGRPTLSPAPTSARPERTVTVPSAPVAPRASSPTAAGPTTAYNSAKYGFGVKYPATWTAADRSAAMTPKKPGNVWVAFTPKTKSAGLAVNVRRMRLGLKTDADMFAKFNPYVSSWERKTVLGSPAFATVTSSPSSKRVTHRLIVIKDGYAWMLNCIDTSGQDQGISQAIFDSVVNSLTILPPAPGTGVTVREVGKKR